MRLAVAALALLGWLAGCGQRSSVEQAAVEPDHFQRELQEKLLDAKPGEIIEIPAGRHVLDRSLSLRGSGVTIRGAGMNATVLSFKDQRVGAEGLLVNASDFTLENLAIEDTRGDAVKINESERITLRGLSCQRRQACDAGADWSEVPSPRSRS